MESNMNIRRIERDDFEFVYHSLCDLENEILDREALQKIFCENIDNPSYSYLIAEIKNEKIGFITLHTQNLLHHCGLVGEIQEFYITEHFRGKGIGRQLIRRIMDLAEENKLKSIEVATNKKRIENINIYENLGFNLTHNKFTIYK
ncbi:GNAT family N-acetyltransferase [Chryseobacterium sp. ISL-6]|nr:GNAT family N-acetyltransferase [Chryseobacterium sp. ISL-6]